MFKKNLVRIVLAIGMINKAQQQSTYFLYQSRA